MVLKNFLTITAILALFFGAALLFAPAMVLGVYGLETDEVGLMFARYFGSSFGGFGLLAWYEKDITDSSARSKIMHVMFYGGIVGSVISIYSQSTGLVNSVGWVSVGLFVVLTLGLAYFIYVKPDSTTT